MIFVFGSNLAGRHGAGAAREALRNHGAIWGQGSSLQGQSYAIPTKDHGLRSLSLDQIHMNVSGFLAVAAVNSNMAFQVTRIGCGLAGYLDEEIGPFFKNAPRENCFFDIAWRPFLGNGFEYWGSYNLSSSS